MSTTSGISHLLARPDVGLDEVSSEGEVEAHPDGQGGVWIKNTKYPNRPSLVFMSEAEFEKYRHGNRNPKRFRKESSGDRP